MYIVIFDLFDFNELNNLSFVDIEFMINSCLNSTFKIYNIKQDLNGEIINSFLKETFNEEDRVNISQLIK